MHVKDKELELNNCNFAKTILMLVICFFHSLLCGNVFTEGTVFSNDIFKIISYLFPFWLNSFHVAAFTLISGYIFYYLRYEKGKYDKFFPFAKNKVKRLIVPYIFVAIFWAIPFHMPFFEADIVTTINGFIMSPLPVSQLWFLLMLFDVFIVSWLLSDIFKKKNLLGLIIIVGLYAFGEIGLKTIPNIFFICTACKFVTFFWIGFKIRQYGSTFIKKIPIFVWIITHIFLFILTYYFFKNYEVIFSILNFFLNIIGGIMAFVVLQKIAECINWEKSKIINSLSKHRMIIYLFHQQIIYLLAEIDVGDKLFIDVFINFIGGIAISILMSFIMMRFKLTRFLVGEK